LGAETYGCTYFGMKVVPIKDLLARCSLPALIWELANWEPGRSSSFRDAPWRWAVGAHRSLHKLGTIFPWCSSPRHQLCLLQCSTICRAWSSRARTTAPSEIELERQYMNGNILVEACVLELFCVCISFSSPSSIESALISTSSSTASSWPWLGRRGEERNNDADVWATG
jgi:hypothetical protein